MNPEFDDNLLVDDFPHSNNQKFPVKNSQKLGSHCLAHPERTQKRCAECAGCRLVVVHDESLDWYSGVCGWMDFFTQLLDGLSHYYLYPIIYKGVIGIVGIPFIPP
jgi:hypothetical protein